MYFDRADLELMLFLFCVFLFSLAEKTGHRLAVPMFGGLGAHPVDDKI